MNRGVTVWRIRDLMKSANQTQTCIDEKGTWVPARPYGWDGIVHRLKAAWIVFKGRGDVVIWDGGQ